MPNMTNTLTATITATEDNTGNVPINRGLGITPFDSTFSDFTTYQNLAAGPTVLSIPGAKATQFYLKNNDPTNSVTVEITPNGGSPITLPILSKGECAIIWQATTSQGISGVTVTPSAGNTVIEYFFGG